MKRLFLLRHADSANAQSGQDDLGRPLTERGRDDATRMGRYLQTQGYIPALTYCSPAVRTRETWACLHEALDTGPEEQFPAGFYLAEPQTLLEAVRGTASAHPSALIISHNPGILALALGLADEDIRAANPFGDYPPAALSVFDFSIESWSGLAAGGGTLKEFVRAGDVLTD